MVDSPQKSAPRLRFAMLIWLASMFGAVSVTVRILPQLGVSRTRTRNEFANQHAKRC